MMAIKNSRAASFAVIALVYALAAVLGIFVYRLLPGAPWLKLLLADVAATVFVFAFSLLFRNASVYDPYWSVQPPAILAAFAFGKALSAAQIWMLAVVFVWSLRLTANWAYTFKGLRFQDWRYTMLREKTGKAYPLINFVGIHLVPTLVVYACVLPAVYLLQSGATLNVPSVCFFALSLLAVLLQGTADVQMHSFRLRRQRGETGACFVRNGLWQYARHPNYLGEILMWWGVGLAAVSLLPQQWYLLLGAFANTCLFAFVSIPMADGRQAKKEGYAAYRAQTRTLLPFPK